MSESGHTDDVAGLRVKTDADMPRDGVRIVNTATGRVLGRITDLGADDVAGLVARNVVTTSGNVVTNEVTSLVSRLLAATFPQCACDLCVERREAASALERLAAQNTRLRKAQVIMAGLHNDNARRGLAAPITVSDVVEAIAESTGGDGAIRYRMVADALNRLRGLA